MFKKLEVNLKYLSLIILIIQNSFTVFVIRYSKTLPDKYLTSTAVVCSEFIKLITSLFVHIYLRIYEAEPGTYNIKILLNELFGKESECLKVIIPAVLYLLQNNLIYYSASKLDAATFQITYQMKLIMTAIFSVLILKRRIYRHQWISIFLLAFGIALVQFPTGDSKSLSIEDENAALDKVFGFLSVIVACLSSGLAGVYFEKILKKSKVTLWARNVQLSLCSIIFGLIFGCLLIDGNAIKENGFFGGYTRWTILAILCQSFGGIIVSLVVKYADNILKGFANSISIILSCAISYLFFDFNITIIFIIGCIMVLYSTYLYSKPSKENIDTKYSELTLLPLKEEV
jgi:UDP-sugar transporter A1/2/3